MHLEAILNKMGWYLNATNKVVESQKTDFEDQLFWQLDDLKDDLGLRFNRAIKSEFDKYNSAIQCFDQNFRSKKRVNKDAINESIIVEFDRMNIVDNEYELNFKDDGIGSNEEDDQPLVTNCYDNL